MDDLTLGLLFLGVSVGVPLAALVLAAIRARRTGIAAALPMALGAVAFVLLTPVGCGGTDGTPATDQCWAVSGVGASVRSTDAIARWVSVDPAFVAFALLAAGAGLAMAAVAYVTRRVTRAPVRGVDLR